MVWLGHSTNAIIQIELYELLLVNHISVPREAKPGVMLIYAKCG